MAHERTCMMCGEKYKYCSHCDEYNSNETWRYLYHDKNCMAIGNIWYAYRGKEITKEQAKKQMNEYKENLEKIFKHHSIAANEIRDIFGIKLEEPKEVEENIEKPVEKNVEVKKENEQKHNFKPQKQFYKK